MFYILVLHNTKQSVDAISAISAISTFLRRHRLFLILDVLQVICGQLRERAYLKLGLDIFPMTTYCLRRDEQPVGYLLRIQTLGNQFHNLCLSIRELTIQARLAYHPPPACTHLEEGNSPPQNERIHRYPHQAYAHRIHRSCNDKSERQY